MMLKRLSLDYLQTGFHVRQGNYYYSLKFVTVTGYSVQYHQSKYGMAKGPSEQ
jgi:hypothetical protein